MSEPVDPDPARDQFLGIGDGMRIYYRVDRLRETLQLILGDADWDEVKNPRMAMLDMLTEAELRLLNEIVYTAGVQRGYGTDWQA